jgi:hypothetical protein
MVNDKVKVYTIICNYINCDGIGNTAIFSTLDKANEFLNTIEDNEYFIIEEWELDGSMIREYDCNTKCWRKHEEE